MLAVTLELATTIKTGRTPAVLPMIDADLKPRTFQEAPAAAKDDYWSRTKIQMLTLARLAGLTTGKAHRLRLQLESDLTKRTPQAGEDAASKAGAMGSVLTRLAEAEVPKDKHSSAQAATS